MPYAVAFVGLCVSVTLFLLGQRGLDALVAHLSGGRELMKSLRDRELDLKEREIAIAEKKVSTGDDHAIPEDLMARINAWEDDFAKSDEERAIRVLYAELKNWDAVRRSLPAYGVQQVRSA